MTRQTSWAGVLRFSYITDLALVQFIPNADILYGHGRVPSFFEFVGTVNNPT